MTGADALLAFDADFVEQDVARVPQQLQVVHVAGDTQRANDILQLLLGSSLRSVWVLLTITGRPLSWNVGLATLWILGAAVVGTRAR